VNKLEGKEKKRRYEWLIVQRSRKTGNPVRTISLDLETDAILSQQPNVSEWIREAIREKAGKEAGIVTLTPAEDDVYSVISKFFSQLSYKGERFPEQLNDEISAEIFDFAAERLSRSEDPTWRSPIYALKLVKKVREDKEFWLELYRKIRIVYLRDLKRLRGRFGELL